MARNIDPWQRKMIVHMIRSKNRLITSQMAKVAQCSERSLTNIRKNLRLFGSARSPPVSVGRQLSIAPIMLDAFCDHLAEKPGLYVEEWLSSYGMSSTFCHHHLASNVLFCGLAGQKESPPETQRTEPIATGLLRT